MATQPPTIGEINTNTVPLVEPDGYGGHVAYVRQDTTPTTDYPAADAAQIDLLSEAVELLREIRDECRATRLAVQETFNEGRADHADFLALSRALPSGD